MTDAWETPHEHVLVESKVRLRDGSVLDVTLVEPLYNVAKRMVMRGDGFRIVDAVTAVEYSFAPGEVQYVEAAQP